MKIIDPSKIITSTELKDKASYTLIGNTKLGVVFDSLPHGIINKYETGMGATSLELKAERNSIIVEPIKITASSKADENTKNGEPTLYIGSKTSYHSNTTEKDIIKYLNDGSIRYKKIIVVADSLPRLFNIMYEIDPNLKSQFFLLIDEADSFQLDSTYRNSMEVCIDIYKEFPATQRALVTATLLDFTDPILKLEPYTTFNYDVPSKRSVNVISTFTPSETAYDKILETLKTHPKEKILVAFNSVSGCFDLAKNIITSGIGYSAA